MLIDFQITDKISGSSILTGTTMSLAWYKLFMTHTLKTKGNLALRNLTLVLLIVDNGRYPIGYYVYLNIYRQFKVV